MRINLEPTDTACHNYINVMDGTQHQMGYDSQTGFWIHGAGAILRRCATRKVYVARAGLVGRSLDVIIHHDVVSESPALKPHYAS